MAMLIIFSCLLLFLSVGTDCSIYSSLIADPSENNENIEDQYVKFFLFRKNDPIGSQEFQINNPDKISSIFTRFAPKKITKILVPGWIDSSQTFNTYLRNTYLNHDDYNIIITDWHKAIGVKTSHMKVNRKISKIVSQFGRFIKRLCSEFNLDPKVLHVIGHGIGAHIAGRGGIYLPNGKIGRVTGLDPIESVFDIKHPEKTISTESAWFVDIIHTSIGQIGVSYQIGHADFFPNHGSRQPGCRRVDLLGYCSHDRAYVYYAESITNQFAFQSTPCEDWNSFKYDNCGADDSNKVSMGEFTPYGIKGMFYLRTHKKPPFSYP